MNSDLEAQLKEMGPGYVEVVDRLVSAYRPADFRANEVARPSRVVRLGRLTGWGLGYLVAASLVVTVALGVLFRPNQSGRNAVLSEYHLAAQVGCPEALREIIRTQNPDGSWKNDFLTRQNALALSNCSDASSRIAYKKAMRNLRRRGLL